jgi:uncharacterized protein (DUF2141 family)
MTRRLFAFAALLAATASAQAADVTITVKNVEVGKGKVSVGICDTGLGGEHCPVGGQQESTADTLEFIFQNIPAGNYAFGAHQDVNQNGERDENFLGIPKEPVALSNGALEKMIPNFADAQVPIAEGAENKVEIELQMYGGGKKAKSASNQR